MPETILVPNETEATRVAAAALLDSLPEGSIIKTLKKHGNPAWPTVWLNTGSHRDPWLCLDPSDREDGESTHPTMYVVRHEGTASITILDHGPEPKRSLADSSGLGLEDIRQRVTAGESSPADARRLLAAADAALALAGAWEDRAAHDRTYAIHVPESIREGFMDSVADNEDRARKIRQVVSTALKIA